MSGTIKGSPAPGRDWWGKRPLSGYVSQRNRSKWWKRHLHKIERRQGKKEATND